MSLTAVEAVRLKSSDKSTITREVVTGNGADKHFKLGHNPVVSSPAPEVRLNDAVLVEGVDYTVNYEQGIISMTLIPVIGASLEFIYYWSIFSDVEVEYFLEEGGGNVTIATAKLLLAWAADAAKLAKRQTLSGGGGLGQVVVDTSVAAKELRTTAQALIDTEQDLGESIPAESLTEIPWTEMSYRQAIGQHVVREHN